MKELLKPPVLSVRDLRVSYGSALAVCGASLSVAQGQAVALIGETGSGKTSVALAVARLLPRSARVTGSTEISGRDLLAMGGEELQRARGSLVGFVPQDAMAALNPVLRVCLQMAEVFRVHHALTRKEANRHAVEALRRVGIPDPPAVARLFPHELSGGMRQRVMIAMALAPEPPLLIADEPTTALDVTTQAEVLRLVARLRNELGTAVLWITHDMGVVAELADSVAVMYSGRIVESAAVADIFERPRHPYTSALLQTLRDLRGGSRGRAMYQIRGHPPTSKSTIPGCPFHPRCPRAVLPLCSEVEPELTEADGSSFACHNPVETEHR